MPSPPNGPAYGSRPKLVVMKVLCKLRWREINHPLIFPPHLASHPFHICLHSSSSVQGLSFRFSLFNVFLKGFFLLHPISHPCDFFFFFSFFPIFVSFFSNAIPSLPLFTKICYSFIPSLWSACLSCSFVFALRSGAGQVGSESVSILT